MNDAEQPAVLGDGERRAARFGDRLGDGVDLARQLGADGRLARAGGSGAAALALSLEIIEDGVDRALADPRAVDLDAAHPALRRERDELGAELVDVAAANAVFLLGEHDDGASLRRLVGKRGELRRVGKLLLAHAEHGHELGRLAVAERDGAGLVEQQRVDVAGRLHRPARHGEHVEAHQPVHAGDADGGQQRADGGRNERHEQRHENDDRDRAAGVSRKARDGRRGEDEDDGHAGEQDVERDLVRRLLALGALDQRNHAVEEGRALRRGDAHLEPVGDHQRAAGDGRAIAAGLANDRRRLSGDGRLVDRGDALDHLAVGGDQVAGFDQHDLSGRKLACRGRHDRAPSSHRR